MNLAKLKTQFELDGYIMLENFFTDPLMEKLHRRTLEHYGQQPDYLHNNEFLNKSSTEVVPWFPQKEGEVMFDDVENSPLLKLLSGAILGDGWKSLYCMTMYSRGGSKGQAWHQDCPPEDKQRFNLNRLVYTMDLDESQGGGIVIKPGTHKTGALTSGAPDENFAEQIVIFPKKGTLIILHGHTWHRVLPIKGPYRISMNFRAIPQDTAEDITDICVYRNMRYQFSTNSVVEENVSETCQ